MENKYRDYYFDNLKCFLMICVVMGHIVNCFAVDSIFFKTIYFIIYSFHMPLFIFISGYFSKKETDIKKILCVILLPYIFFQILYKLFQSIMIDETLYLKDIITPYWIMWFLFSLFIWKVTIIVIKKSNIKPKYVIVFFIFLSFIIGYYKNMGDFLALGKTITFFPFFILGYYCKGNQIKVINSINKFAIVTLSLILSGLLYFLIKDTNMSFGWLQANISYYNLGYTKLSLMPIVYRITVTLINILFGIIILRLIPKKEIFFSKIGKNTIYTYLLHGFIIRTILYKGGFNYIRKIDNDILVLSIIFIISIAITLITTSKPIIKILNPIITPKLFHIKRKTYQLNY